MAEVRDRGWTLGSYLLSFLVISWLSEIGDSKLITVESLKHSAHETAHETYRRLRSQMAPTFTQEKLSPPAHSSQYQTLSVVMETSKKRHNRFIQVQSSPSIYPPNNVILIEYECLGGEMAAVEVEVWTVYNQRSRPIRHTWLCSEHSKHTGRVFQSLQLPDGIVYQPDFLNRDVQIIERIELSVWILSIDAFRSKKRGYFDLSSAKARYSVQVLPTYARPRKKHHSIGCLTWDAEMMLKYSRRWNGILQCNKENEVIDLMTFPVALHSGFHGVSRNIAPYKEPGLRLLMDANINNPKFTISAYIFLLDYCKHSLCSLIHRKTQYTNRYVTPLIFLKQDGQVFVQIENDKKSYMSMLNKITLPLKEWIQMVYVQDGRKWSIQFFTQASPTSTHLVGRSTYTNDVHYNETDAFYHLGGSSAVRSFNGFMVEAKLWRHQAIDPQQVATTPFGDLNYTSDISRHYQQCDSFHLSMERIFDIFKLKHEDKLKKVTCPSHHPYLADNLGAGEDDQESCRLWEQPAPRRQLRLWRLLQQSAAINNSYAATHEWIGHQLYQHVLQRLPTEGLQGMKTNIPWLRQASCYGNMDAASLLATVYNAGLGVQTNVSKAVIFWLVAAQGGNHLAMLALASKHHQGIDGVPVDMDYAFNYYFKIAQETALDRTKHTENDIHFEAIRLTDEQQLQTQTGESGDYFKWLKHQAKQGVADAQLNLARMYYHGAAGVQRDMAAAAEFYRLNAEQNPADPVAQYDYAVLHLRGQGVEKDEEKGMDYLNKSAALGHGPAYTALGWYKLNFDHDDKAAAHYFERGDALGHRDAAHNLGYMHLHGRYPGKSIDRMKAFEYYLKAAKADHWDSGVKVAELYNQGNEQMARNDAMAAAWARYVAEKNRDVAWVLRWALDAYLESSWSQSLVYYAIAAEAGLEVGQFNLAYLFDENHDGIAERYIDKDCAWKYWHLAAASVHPHLTSILKVADYHWYGYKNISNQDKAVEYYIQAAETRQSHAVFNLANLIENGVNVKDDVLIRLGVPTNIFSSKNNISKVMELYRICRDSSEDAYFPCGLALLNLQLRQVWKEHNLSIQVASGCMVCLLTLYTAATFLGYLGGSNAPKNINNNNSNNNADASTEQQEDVESTQSPTTLLSVAATSTTTTTTTTSSAQGVERDPATLESPSTSGPSS
nr:protein sel-1 homolog 3-like [Lytechinus pictus]